MKLCGAILLVLTFTAASGCGPGFGETEIYLPEAVSRVDKATVLTIPTAVNLDNVPGPDGLRVQVYLFQYDRAEPVAVDGTIEFLLYEGKIGLGDLRTLEPFGFWQYDAESLKSHLMRGMIGWGYTMQLNWGEHTPRSRVVSLAVRYVPDRGKEVYSSPTTIEVGGY